MCTWTMNKETHGHVDERTHTHTALLLEGLSMSWNSPAKMWSGSLFGECDAHHPPTRKEPKTLLLTLPQLFSQDQKCGLSLHPCWERSPLQWRLLLCSNRECCISFLITRISTQPGESSDTRVFVALSLHSVRGTRMCHPSKAGLFCFYLNIKPQSTSLVKLCRMHERY